MINDFNFFADQRSRIALKSHKNVDTRKGSAIFLLSYKCGKINLFILFRSYLHNYSSCVMIIVAWYLCVF